MAKTARGKSDPHPATVELDETAESQSVRPTQEEIAVRAYHIYLERGEAEGSPTDDWLQAERELSQASDQAD